MVIPCDAMTLIIEGSLNEKRVRKVAKLNNYFIASLIYKEFGILFEISICFKKNFGHEPIYQKHIGLIIRDAQSLS